MPIAVPSARRSLEEIALVLFVFWGVGITMPTVFWVHLWGGGFRIPSLVLTAAAVEAGLVLLLAAWVVLSLLGRVGTWTGAGFRLAVLGYVGWWYGAFLTDFGGASPFLPHADPVRTWLWLVRNASLLVLGAGVGLVIAYSAVDWRRRGRVPAWTRGGD
jgi:hypothetical protein